MSKDNRNWIAAVQWIVARQSLCRENSDVRHCRVHDLVLEAESHRDLEKVILSDEMVLLELREYGPASEHHGGYLCNHKLTFFLACFKSCESFALLRETACRSTVQCSSR